MEKHWKVLRDYPNYKVSDKGEVFSIKSNKIIKQKDNGHGYMTVALYKNGKGKFFYVHRLVGLYFLENKEEKPEINHIDGNKQNNNVENLEWVTGSENRKHAWKKGLCKVTPKFLESCKRNMTKCLGNKKKLEEGRGKGIKIRKARGKKAHILDQKKSFIILYCLELKRVFLNASRVEEKLGIKQNTMLCSIKRKHETCGGYHWKVIKNRWSLKNNSII